MPRPIRPAIERVLARVVVDNSTACWNFTGAQNGVGYGVVGAGRRGDGNVFTHRVTYEHYIGPIPPGMDIDHLCRNRVCCNPDHLEAVTRRENIMRGHHPWVLRDADALKKAHDIRWGRTA